jgi:hypothetical protein
MARPAGGSESTQPAPADRHEDPASGIGTLVPEGYYEEVLLVVTQGGARPGGLLARRSVVFGRYAGKR